MAKNPNGAGTDAYKRSDGRYETRATLDTPTGRRRVTFYGATAKEANDKKFAALADQAKGALFTDPGRLTAAEYLQRWLSDSARYQVAASTYGRYEGTFFRLGPWCKSRRNPATDASSCATMHLTASGTAGT